MTCTFCTVAAFAAFCVACVREGVKFEAHEQADGSFLVKLTGGF